MPYNLHGYPADLGDAVQVVIDGVRGRPVPKVEYAHAGWHVIGFGLSKVDDAHGPVGKGNVKDAKCFDAEGKGCFSNEELAVELEKLKGGDNSVKALEIDWLKLIRTLACLLFDLCPN
jgi:hypothetical protein